MDLVNLEIVIILTVGFALASILGFLSYKAGLSSLLGYLIAGYLIGPYSPGIVIDSHTAEQLAEIGVILMMFGVGMHFKWEDLASVKSVAIPGAFGQTFVTALFSTLFIYSLGWTLESGLIIGLSIGVASTVVLVRVLSDNEILSTPQGHIAVGWLIVEDIFTVAVLILLPSIAANQGLTGFDIKIFSFSILILTIKFISLAFVVFYIGTRVVTYLLFRIARTRSHELFTLAVLAITFAIALGSALIFGTSIALGAFLAGMVIGRTEVRHQASAHVLPLKDAFVVIFFLSVGMLFDPRAMVENFSLFTGVLAIILIVKPLTAFLIVYFLGYSVEVGLVVALSLAQIGEFSFILAEEAMKYKLLPDAGYDILVASALISIAINPLLFKSIKNFKYYLEKLLHQQSNDEGRGLISKEAVNKAIVVGYGPIGRAIYQTLQENGFSPIVIDRNVDTISKLLKEGKEAIYGDASKSNIQEIAGMEKAVLLAVTLPEINESISVIETARDLHPPIYIVARTRYISDKPFFENLDIPCICCEEEGLKAFREVLAATMDEIKKPKD
ncbi:cation:proton antiporter [Criblamydia sequanensis]|uniref:Sodium/hydrogen exchanger n=1 Tax=Candidatus Criblamydia sequanensis CRIB-18 TaxID=1437425 RepID=A0A090D026_9BACT|nr:cation:proton antiporter [Criblamydia sequanensis]CDR34807.1 Sodium/hydrogen exchanger [Criblamydia sequanensis CRIB-18]